MNSIKATAASASGGAGFALSTIAFWAVEAIAKLDVPDAVELAGGTLATAVLAWVVTYFAPANT